MDNQLALLTLCGILDLERTIADHRQFYPVIESPALHSSTSFSSAFSF